MRQVFHRRRVLFLNRCLKYLRYVLNDHFILVLLVFLGFIFLQYRELLLNFPQEPWLILCLLGVLSLLFLFAGRVATYLEEPDQVFLLAKEAELWQLVKEAHRHSLFLWAGIQFGGQWLLFPIYSKLGLPLWGFLLYQLLLFCGKYLLWHQKVKKYQRQGRFHWTQAIADEQGRKQTILQFFSLFTTVKGVTSRVKRRAYLDKVLSLVGKSQGQTWAYLYLRAFLRAGDFFALGMRLGLLSLLSLFVLEETWLAVGLASLFTYLLLFQLLALYRVYDYQYMSRLYPLDVSAKLAGFKRVLQGILYGLTILQLVCGLFWVKEKLYLLVWGAVALFLGQVYLQIKSKKLIDY